MRNRRDAVKEGGMEECRKRGKKERRLLDRRDVEQGSCWKGA